MMNSKKSSRYQLIRYMVLGVLVGGLVLSLNYTKASAALNFIHITVDSVPAAKKVTVAPKVTQPGAQTIKGAPASKAAKSPNVITLRKTNGQDPVYVVDGEILSKSAMEAINPNTIESVNVVKAPTGAQQEDLVGKYGEGAGNGVIFVTLKKPKAIGISIRGGSATGQATGGDPLILVDNEALPKGKSIDDIPTDKISSVEILKDGAAKALYGAAAVNGVILIKTKEGAAATGIQNIQIRVNDSTTVK